MTPSGPLAFELFHRKSPSKLAISGDEERLSIPSHWEMDDQKPGYPGTRCRNYGRKSVESVDAGPAPVESLCKGQVPNELFQKTADPANNTKVVGVRKWKQFIQLPPEALAITAKVLQLQSFNNPQRFCTCRQRKSRRKTHSFELQRR